MKPSTTYNSPNKLLGFDETCAKTAQQKNQSAAMHNL